MRIRFRFVGQPDIRPSVVRDMPTVPRQGDYVALGEDAGESFMVASVGWYPDEPDYDAWVTLR